MDENCSFCGSAMRHWYSMPIDAKKNEITPFNEILRCDICQIGMLTPQPTPEQIPELYVLPAYYTHGEGESHIRPVKPTLFDKVLTKIAWTFDKPTPFVPESITLPPNADVLDLGCGNGHLLNKFKALGHKVIGIDPDIASIQQASERNIEVLDGTAETIPAQLLGKKFDLVSMTHALEHCLNPSVALRNAFNLTKPGGVFYAEVPNCSCVHFETLGPCSEMFDSPRHLWFFTPNGLRQIIEKAGFSFASWCFEGFTRHHAPEWRGWERQILKQVQSRITSNTSDHTFTRSVSILARSAFATNDKKYDCVGVIARK